MATPTLDRDTILEGIQAWSLADKMALAQAIFQQASSQLAQAPQRPSWREMAGLAANGQEPPSDEQVARGLDERRMEKYGR